VRQFTLAPIVLPYNVSHGAVSQPPDGATPRAVTRRVRTLAAEAKESAVRTIYSYDPAVPTELLRRSAQRSKDERIGRVRGALWAIFGGTPGIVNTGERNALRELATVIREVRQRRAWFVSLMALSLCALFTANAALGLNNVTMDILRLFFSALPATFQIAILRPYVSRRLHRFNKHERIDLRVSDLIGPLTYAGKMLEGLIIFILWEPVFSNEWMAYL
jgi:hypothetical protein